MPQRPAWGSSGAIFGSTIDLERPPPGPAAGQARPWEWSRDEPLDARERSLARLSVEAYDRARQAAAGRRRLEQSGGCNPR